MGRSIVVFKILVKKRLRKRFLGIYLTTRLEVLTKYRREL